jgi:3-hydroxyisobutyrate dehydrogenase
MMMGDRQTIAVLGAGGTMGFPIARNLARAGFAVRAWNRSREKAEPLSEDGAEICGLPGDAIEGSDVILTMLADADAVTETMNEALADRSSNGSLWLQMSTIGEQGTERCAGLAAEHKLTYVDAPVLGSKEPAERRELVVLASGPSDVREQLEPIFDALGQRTMWVGEAGSGSRLKIAINTWIVTVVEGTAETFALAEGLGLDPQLVLEAVSGGALDLPYMQMKGGAIIEKNYEPSFRLALAAKDAALADESARRHNLDLPLVRTVRERLEQGAADHPDKDMIATYLTSAP